MFILVGVVVAFYVCWTPFHAQRIFSIYGNPQSVFHAQLFNALVHISGILYFVSTAINPILYHILSEDFRKAFKVSHNITVIFMF